MEVELARACTSMSIVPKYRFIAARGPCFLRLRSRMLVKRYGVAQCPQDVDVQDRKPASVVCSPQGCRKQASRCRRRNSMVLAATGGEGLSYKDAGVDIDAGNELVRRIKKMNPSIGGFSGMVPFGASLCTGSGLMAHVRRFTLSLFFVPLARLALGFFV